MRFITAMRARPQSKNAVAPPRHARAEIVRPQNIRAVVKVVGDLHLAECVVAKRDDVRSRGEDALGVVRRQADHRGILAVDHGEVDVLEFFSRRADGARAADTAAAHHIADGQNIVEHGVPPLCVFPSIARRGTKRKKGMKKGPAKAEPFSYFAYSMAVVSRRTCTLIWPGYSISSSIFFGKLARQNDHLVLADLVGLDHHADLAAGLNGIGLVDAGIAAGDLLKLLGRLM